MSKWFHKQNLANVLTSIIILAYIFSLLFLKFTIFSGWQASIESERLMTQINSNLKEFALIALGFLINKKSSIDV